jgi:matrixin
MRNPKLTTRFVWLAVVLAIATIVSPHTAAYTTNGNRWAYSPVNYFVNASNLDLPSDLAQTAVRAGADAWTAQSRARFRFAFAGASAQTTTTNDGINLVVLRNASNGAAIATTYWWSTSAGIVDADIVFWDAAFRFFSGASGCASGFYIEDIATHEFGHALGLGHSTLPSATMYPSTSSCSVNNRSLDPDDIAGVETLYPALSNPPSPPTGLRTVGGGD